LGYGRDLKQKLSPAHLVWPIIFLPLSAWLIAVLALAVGLFLLRRLPRRPAQWADSGYGEQKLSLANLLWAAPVALLFGWLAYGIGVCPSNPPGDPLLGLTELAPPILLVGFILTLRWALGPPYRWVHMLLAVGLGSAFLAACGWGLWWGLLGVGMGQCLA